MGLQRLQDGWFEIRYVENGKMKVLQSGDIEESSCGDITLSGVTVSGRKINQNTSCQHYYIPVVKDN